MDFIKFLKDNLPNGYKIEAHSELSFKFKKGIDNVVVRVQQGNQYQRGAVMPITIMVVSENTNEAMKNWREFVLNTSDRDYNEGTENYYMIFQTPNTAQLFDEISNNYYSVITIFGTIVETNGVLDITKITIDGIEVIPNELSYQLVSTPSMEQLSTSPRISKSRISNSVLSLNLTTFFTNYGTLTTKLNGMRTGTIDPDTVFSIVLQFNGDLANEIVSMKLSNQAIVKNRGSITLMTLSFVK